jgi:carbamoyl-phosphate synthase large subunit
MRKKPVTVLVTGGGAPGIAGTLYALRNNPDGVRVRVITCDMRDEVIGKYLADEFYLVPSGESPDFIETLLEIASRRNVDVILPQVNQELLPLAKNLPRFNAHGIAVAVAQRASIERANDKWAVLEAAKACGVPYPEGILTCSEIELVQAVKALGYPVRKVVVKPRLSNGLRGLRILSEELWDVTRFLKEKPGSLEIPLDELLAILRNGCWPELIVQEFLPGAEYTVDVFRGRYGAIAIPRLREEIRSGITFQARVELRADLERFSLQLAEELDLRYAFGFQFKLSEEGTPKLLECNPRVQGTMVTAVFAGCNVIWWAVKEALGDEVIPNKPARSVDGMRLLRYWGGLAVYGDGKTAGPI